MGAGYAGLRIRSLTMSNKNIYLKYGKVLIEQGAEDDKSAYIIEDGSLSVHKDGKHICDLHKGGFVGEMSWILGEPRSATVTSISENCQVREITADEFSLLWETNPKALLPVLRVLTDRIANTTRSLAETKEILGNLQKTLRNGNGG